MPQRQEVVLWRGGRVRVKRVRLLDGGKRARPGYEDVARAVSALGMTPLAAYRAMLADGVAAELGTEPRRGATPD